MLPCEGFPSGATVGYAKAQVRDILKAEFNKSVELQVRSSVHFTRGERKDVLFDCLKNIQRGVREKKYQLYYEIKLDYLKA